MLNPFRKKTKTDNFLDGLKLQPEVRSQAENAFTRVSIDQYESADDRERDLQLINQLMIMSMEQNKPTLKSIGGSMIGTPGNPIGYQPGGSYLKKIYPNDFTRWAFLAEAYWACRKSRNETIVETARDGYVLTSTDKVSKKTIKAINNVLIDLDVPRLRISMKDTLLWCGNVVMNNQYNRRGGLLKLNPLLMSVVSPRWDQYGYHIMGWDIIYGNGIERAFIPAEDTQLIKTFNARSNALGVSALGCLEVDIEAALQASIYNNNLMAKGGLLSVLIRMANPKDGQIVNDSSVFKKADELSKWLERRFGGIRGSGQLAFIPGVEGVDVLNKVGDMDGAWQYLDRSTASKVALQFGLSPERIGLPKTSQYQNKDMVMESMALSADNNFWYSQSLIDDYITEVVIRRQLGIDNVVIESSGEFSSFSKAAAEFGQLVANFGVDTMTVDEWRQSICHIKPLGGDLGQKFLGEVLRKEMEMQPQGAAEATKALGATKLLLPDYQDYRSELISHHHKAIRFY